MVRTLPILLCGLSLSGGPLGCTSVQPGARIAVSQPTPAPPARVAAQPSAFASGGSASNAARPHASTDVAAGKLVLSIPVSVDTRRSGEVRVVYRDAAKEAEGVRGFVVLSDERIVILDGENERLLVFQHGVQQLELALDNSTYEEPVFLSEDRIALLDRVHTKGIAVWNLSGKLERRSALDSAVDWSSVRQLTPRPDGIWAEYTGGKMLRLLRADGSVDTEHTQLQGFLTGDGNRLVTWANPRPSKELKFSSTPRAGGAATFEHRFAAAQRENAGEWASDASGKLYLVIYTQAAGKAVQLLRVYSARLELQRELVLEAGDGEQTPPTRRLFVTADGRAYWASFAGQQLRILRY